MPKRIIKMYSIPKNLPFHKAVYDKRAQSIYGSDINEWKF